jgi:hypothetical protein
MAAMAHEKLAKPAHDLRVLVGGLGAGHTLRAALALPGVTAVVVAEIGAKVVEWNRRYFAAVNGRAVDDPRVTVRIADLADVLRDSPHAFDLLLLMWTTDPAGWPRRATPRCTKPRACAPAATLAPRRRVAVWSPTTQPHVFRHAADIFPAAEQLDTAALGRPLGEPATPLPRRQS